MGRVVPVTKKIYVKLMQDSKSDLQKIRRMWRISEATSEQFAELEATLG